MTSLALHRTGLGRAILTGWLVVGTVDILDAILMTLWRGGTPTRMLQGIASGMLGPAAFEGGPATAVLGLGIHFFIALVVVTSYLVASQRFEQLIRGWVGWGITYGLAVWAFMHFVVIPLSQIHRFPKFTVAGTINQLLIHAFGVGLLTAWFARRTRES